jgi:hypothetical protein
MYTRRYTENSFFPRENSFFPRENRFFWYNVAALGYVISGIAIKKDKKDGYNRA